MMLLTGVSRSSQMDKKALLVLGKGVASNLDLISKARLMVTWMGHTKAKEERQIPFPSTMRVCVT